MGGERDEAPAPVASNVPMRGTQARRISAVAERGDPARHLLATLWTGAGVACLVLGVHGYKISADVHTRLASLLLSGFGAFGVCVAMWILLRSRRLTVAVVARVLLCIAILALALTKLLGQ